MRKGSERIDSDSKMLYRKLSQIAVPIAIQGVVSATLGLIDNLMVGVLGETELAAVGIATQPFYVFYLLMFGFTSGIATFVAQFYGTKNYENIRKVIGLSVVTSLCAGTIFFTGGFFFTRQLIGLYTSDPELIRLAVSYVRIGAVCFFFMAFSIPFEMAFKATQQTKIPMIVSTVVFFTNVILNYILIFGKFGAPALGVAGASIATTIARFFEVLITLIFAVRKSNRFRGPIKSFFGRNREMVIRIIHNALPTTINELFWSLGQTMYVAAFTRIGTTAYAAYQAAAAINSLYTFAAFSIGDAALVLIGEKLGEGKKDEAYILGKRLLKIGIFIGFLIGIALVITAKPLVGLFNLSPLGKTYTFRILLVYGLTMALNLYNGMNITGTLRGGGDTKFAMITECSSVWLIGVPMAFIASMVLHVPIYLAVLLIKLEDVAKCIVLTKRFLSKKWIKNVIHGL